MVEYHWIVGPKEQRELGKVVQDPGIIGEQLGSFFIVPTACFEDGNATNYLGVGSLTDEFSSFVQYMVLSVFLVFATVVIGIDSPERCCGAQGVMIRAVSLILRALPTVASGVIVVYAALRE